MANISIDEGWPLVEEVFAKLVRVVEGAQEESITSDDYMKIYERIYKMCQQNGADEIIYGRYKSLLEDYIKKQVLPALAQKHDLYLLEELAKRWSNHLLMIRWVERFFHYLDRYYISKKGLPTLKDAGLECFHVLVYNAIEARAKDAFLTLINREKEGEKIDRGLLKKTMEFFVSIKPGDLEFYENNLEALVKNDEELSKLLGTVTKNTGKV